MTVWRAKLVKTKLSNCSNELHRNLHLRVNFSPPRIKLFPFAAPTTQEKKLQTQYWPFFFPFLLLALGNVSRGKIIFALCFVYTHRRDRRVTIRNEAKVPLRLESNNLTCRSEAWFISTSLAHPRRIINNESLSDDSIPIWLAVHSPTKAERETWII